MNIAVLADRLTMGGLETHILTLTNALLKRGHRILLNTAYTNPALLDRICAGFNQFFYRPWSDDSLRDVASFAPDLIHAHPFTAIYRGYEVARNLNRPMIVTMHGLYDFGLDHSPLGEKICEYVKSIIAVDLRVADLLKKSISHPEKIEVIYNGIDLHHFLPGTIRREIHPELDSLNPNWKTVVILSRMSDGKEQPIYQVLECAPPLSQRLNGLNLVIVGGGPSYSALQEKAAAVNSGNRLLQVKLTGEQWDVQPFLTIADLVLACDRAALEAMACQKAVLAMNAQGFAEPIQLANFREILLNRSGFLSLRNEFLIQKMVELLQDDARRRVLGEAGREIVRHYFDIHQIALKMEKMCQRLLDRHSVVAKGQWPGR